MLKDSQMKKIGITIWQNRIAPLFDVAKNILILKEDKGQVVSKELFYLPEEGFHARIIKILSLNLDVVICGGISRPYFEVLISNGTEVIPFIAGDVEEIESAFLNNILGRSRYAMPGCFRQRKNILRRWMMPGQGNGRGMGGGGRMRGKPDGVCVCPKCGYKEEHLRGEPCFEKTCPKCNTPLQRG